MSKLLSVIVAALFAVASVTALAQEKKADKKAAPAKTEKSMDKKDTPKKEPSAAQKKQQERMKECNAQADDKKLKGDDRKKFMSGCLKPAPKKGEAKTERKMDSKKSDKK